MLTVQTSAEFPFPAGKVWELVAGFNNLPLYHAAITNSELTEGGRFRLLSLHDDAGGGQILEKMLHFDDAAMTFTYNITEYINTPLPFRNYVSTVKVEENGPDACRMHWSGEFTAKEGATEEETKAAARGVYEGGYEGIRKRLGS